MRLLNNDPATHGDPMSPLKWTSKSLRNLAGALRALGHRLGHDVVDSLLKRRGYRSCFRLVNWIPLSVSTV